MTAAARLVYEYLRSQPRHRLAYGQADIAAATGVSVKTVARALGDFEQRGIIRRFRRGKLGGGRKGDYLAILKNNVDTGARQGRFFTSSSQKQARPASALWMSLINEFVKPWQHARGRALTIGNRRQVMGQWATLCQREARAEVRAEMVKRYLAATDAFVRDKDWPLGILLARFAEYHAHAIREVNANAARRRTHATATLETSTTPTGQHGAAVERFTRMLRARGGAA